jgi:tetratricopeptide (TPR) repeat protein
MKQATERRERKVRSRARPSRRNVSRRWCIPPAILREPEEMLEASQILDEVPGDVGLLLWQALRDVTLWASVPQERHAGLFGGEAAGKRLRLLLASDAEPALEVWLTALTNVVANPVTVSPDIVSLVCMQLSRWAEARGALATALCYAQAGALATPEDPAPAYSVGTLALRWRRNTRAETWLRRAVGLARRAKDWNVYAQAHVDLAALYARRGAREPAQRSYVQAQRAARRHGLMPVRGAALHGLFLMAMEAGELDDAERFARLAMRAYGRGHPRLAELAHDTAYLWVTRDSYTRAIPILQKQLSSRVDPVERALTLSILARAAAGAGDQKLYQNSSMDAWALISRKAGEEMRHARALLELARAGVKARDWVHMDRAARAALSAATRTGETTIVAQVESLLAQLRRNLRL